MAQEILIADNASYSQNDKELLRNLYRKINELVYIINTKDSGIFNDEEFFTSQQWYVGKDQGEQQMIYRKAYGFGALPNTGVINIPHGLALTADWDFIKIYATSKNPGAIQWIPLTNPEISYMVDAVNINITTTADLSAYTNTRVVLEYTQP